MTASDDGEIAPLTIAQEGKTYVESKLKAAGDHYPIMTERGWADASCHAVAAQVLVKEMEKKGLSKALLFVDGANDHLDVNILVYLVLHNVTVVILPPGCSGKLQPLDLTVFGPTKRVMVSMAEEDNVILSTNNVVQYFHAACTRTSKRSGMGIKEWAIAGFKKAGISPFNIDAFSWKDFTAAGHRQGKVITEESHAEARESAKLSPDAVATLLEEVRAFPNVLATPAGQKAMKRSAAFISKSIVLTGNERLSELIAKRDAKEAKATGISERKAAKAAAKAAKIAAPKIKGTKKVAVAASSSIAAPSKKRKRPSKFSAVEENEVATETQGPPKRVRRLSAKAAEDD
jgi:hypothetical protein